MDFFKLIKQRYSCRNFNATPIELEKLELVLEAARLAPTAANRQPFKIIVIDTAEYENELSEIYAKKWFTSAPYVLAITTVKSDAWANENGTTYEMLDAGIVFDHLSLMATEIGLATCWVAAFNIEKANEFLKSDGYTPIAFMPIGYPEDHAFEKKRKPINDIVSYKLGKP